MKKKDQSSGKFITNVYPNNCRTCSDCGYEKDLSLFGVKSRDTNSKVYLKPLAKCNECMHVRNVEKSILKNAGKEKGPIAKDGHKFCTECDKELPLDSFPPRAIDPNHKDFGKTRGECRECKIQKEWDIRNPGQTRVYAPVPKEGYKFCSMCDCELPTADFGMRAIDPNHEDYGKLLPYCKVCRVEVNATYWEKHPEKVVEILEEKAQWRKDHPEESKQKDRVSKIYKKGLGQYKDLILNLLDNYTTCPGCNAPRREDREADIDHCHTTIFFRLLLCSNCNNLLGKARDNPQTIENLLCILTTFLSLEQVMSKHAVLNTNNRIDDYMRTRRLAPINETLYQEQQSRFFSHLR